jgi:hypothetical protein
MPKQQTDASRVHRLSPWAIARIVLLLICISTVFIGSSGKPPVDWRLSLIVAFTGSIGLFVWLSMIRHQNQIVWSNRYSWDTPFFPIMQYPLQFWLFAAHSLILSGVVGLLTNVWFPRENAPLSEMFLILGIAVLLTLHIWMKLFFKNA